MQSRAIQIDIATQSLELWEGDLLLHRFPISSSANGIGSEPGSFKTPVGRFCIAEKIGENAALGTVFKSRQPIDETEISDPGDDLVQTRILWLHGLEPQNANTRERYIYIHGTNDEAAIGTPASHGCIRMRNADVVTLFDAVAPGTPVEITA